MARHLRAHFAVRVWNRTRARVDALAAFEGVDVCATPPRPRPSPAPTSWPPSSRTGPPCGLGAVGLRRFRRAAEAGHGGKGVAASYLVGRGGAGGGA
ncbi:hypothetical protein GPA10_27040 [Streptomyces sp. p1417]|uniref:Uncharacterized protein n=1 Tax=Streptomyces typhae TaxID=2681492 RepID=A0A6L6X420_9ACTN|nr:hypothetical protein [Streptomyces typhae]